MTENGTYCAIHGWVDEDHDFTHPSVELDGMHKYSVSLLVEMDAESPQQAAEKVAEMAEGWTYSVAEVYTNTEPIEVHLEYGKAQA